jgi:prolyl 4-hydroxylase
MEPGDMVLYESHSVLHGVSFQKYARIHKGGSLCAHIMCYSFFNSQRPFPLKGRFAANLFIHFEPNGHSLRHNAKGDGGSQDVHAKYRASLDRGHAGHEHDTSGLPDYVIAGTPEELHWRKAHPNAQVRTDCL